MKQDATTPAELLKFFRELDSAGPQEAECEIHYGCACVIHKGLKAAQMLSDVQKALGLKDLPASKGTAGEKPAGDKAGGAPAGEEPSLEAQLAAFEAALMNTDAPAKKDESAEALSEAEAEIDRLLIQTVELKDENKNLKDKIREMYKQIERLHTRQEMSKLLGGLEEREAREKAAGQGKSAGEQAAAEAEDESAGEQDEDLARESEPSANVVDLAEDEAAVRVVEDEKESSAAKDDEAESGEETKSPEDGKSGGAEAGSPEGDEALSPSDEKKD